MSHCRHNLTKASYKWQTNNMIQRGHKSEPFLPLTALKQNIHISAKESLVLVFDADLEEQKYVFIYFIISSKHISTCIDIDGPTFLNLKGAITKHNFLYIHTHIQSMLPFII